MVKFPPAPQEKAPSPPIEETTIVPSNQGEIPKMAVGTPSHEELPIVEEEVELPLEDQQAPEIREPAADQPNEIASYEEAPENAPNEFTGQTLESETKGEVFISSWSNVMSGLLAP